MKKISLCFALLIGSTLAAIAQDTTYVPTPAPEPERTRFRIGLVVAPSMSWFNTQGESSVSEGDGVRLNIKYGILLDFALGRNENYYFSTGVFGFNTGGTIRHSTLPMGGTLTVDHRINYINVPTTIMLKTASIGYIQYFGRVGVDHGFAIKSTYDTDLELGGITTTTEDQDDPDNSTLYRAGLHLELGAEMNISGNTNLFLSAEFNHGFTNVLNKDYGDQVVGANGSVKATTSAFMVNVGVYF